MLTESIEKIKISVCVPIYGVEKYIERCARSLFEQTMIDGIEFIFVNDCTKDKSIEILEAVLAEYPQRKDQVRIIHHEKNSGLVAARNTGLKHAAGDYIIHCDSDDWVDLNMYENMYNKAVECDADMVYCDYKLEAKDTKEVMINKLLTSAAMLNGILDTSIHGALWNKMFRKEIALDEKLYAPEHICLMEDTLRVSQMLLNCKKIVKCDMPVFYHYQREHDGSYTDVNSYKIQQFYTSCEIVEFLSDHLPQCYMSSMVGLKGNVLFKAVKHCLLSPKEFDKLWKSERYNMLKCRSIHIIKRIVLFFSFISYISTAKMCVLLLKINAFMLAGHNNRKQK